MAKQIIFVGSNPNDGTGDLLRNAMVKANSNFDELYSIHSVQHGEYKVAYGSNTPVIADNGEVLTHGTNAVQFSITKGAAGMDQIEINLAAPSIILSGAQGPIAVQRIIGTEVTNVYAFIVSSIDNGYHITFEDTHGASEADVITYRLYNMTGSDGTAGAVTFPTTYGFQFCGKET